MVAAIKTIITTVLLSALLTTTSDAEARLKYYRYNANIPMVEMTLNMMVAMGVLEQIPGRLVHDGNPYSRFINTQYGRYARAPYALPASRGYVDSFGYDGYAGGAINPYAGYATGPYAYRDPYSASGDLPGSWGSPWGSPWGGSAWNDPWADPWYNTWGSPRSGAYASQWPSPWSSPWGNRLNSPWMGAWNNRWDQGWNSPWVSPWSSTLINPYANPYGAAGAFPRVPGDVSMLAPQGYVTPGTATPQFGAPAGSLPVNPSQGAMMPGYQSQGVLPPGYLQPGTVTPSYPQQGAFPPAYPQPGTVTPGYPQQSTVSPSYTQPGMLTPGNRPQGVLTPTYLAPGSAAAGYDMPGYAPGNTSANSYQNPAAPSVSDQGRRLAPLNPPQTPPAGQFSINNISTGSSAHPGKPGSSGTDAESAAVQASRRATLDGLWIGDSGEMLGIRGNSFLWYDGNNGYTNGQLLKTRRMLKAQNEGSAEQLSMRYRLIGDELFTVGHDGTLRVFNRAPLMQSRLTANELYATPSSYQRGVSQSGMSGSGFGALATTPLAADTGTASDLGIDASYQQRHSRAGASFSAHSGSPSPMWGRVGSPANASALLDRPKPSAARPEMSSAEIDTPQYVSVEPALTKNTDELAKTLPAPPGDTTREAGVVVTQDAKRTSASVQRDASTLVQFGGTQWSATPSIQLSEESADIWKPLTPFAMQPLATTTPAGVDAQGRQDGGNQGEFSTPSIPTFPRYPSHWNQQSSAATPSQDPERFLYSYIKNLHRAFQVSAPPTLDIENSNIWRPSAAYLEKGHKGFRSTSERSQARSNIWKPSWSVRDRDARHTGLETYYSPNTASSEAQDRDDASVRKFFWAENMGWD